MDNNRQSDLHRTIAPLRRKIGEGIEDREILRLSFPPSLIPSVSHYLRLSAPLSFCLSVFLLASCSHTVTEAEKKAAVDEFFAGARSCRPPDASAGEEAGAPRLAVESIVSNGKATLVRLVAYAPDEEVDFYLPIYRRSAGRWLINEKGRVYLLDEECRELRLNESNPSPKSSLIFWGGGQIPEGGRIRLKPGQAFETTLDFPRFPDRTRVGALVYGGRVLPFALN